MLRIFVAPFLVAALATLVPVSGASADECDNARGGQAGLNECYGNLFKKSDAELNRLYREIEGRLKDDPDAKKRLVTAQRAWVAFRDAECGFRSGAASDGSAGPMILSMCLDGLTRQRSADFASYLKCEEGDLSCPVPAAD